MKAIEKIRELEQTIRSLTEFIGDSRMEVPDATIETLKKNLFVEKEKLVKEVHGTRSISQLNSGTRAGEWKAYCDGKCVRQKTYEALIEAMFTVYFPDGLQDKVTFADCFEQMLEYRRTKAKVSGLTLSHYQSDYAKYVNQRKNFPVSRELTQSFFGRLTEKVDIFYEMEMRI